MTSICDTLVKRIDKMPKEGISVTDIDLEVQKRLYDDRERFYKKKFVKPTKLGVQLPEYLLNWQEPISYKPAE